MTSAPRRPRPRYDPAVTTTALKLLLTPALIAVATVIARRCGPAIGGTVAGLPLTSTPVSIVLVLEQGTAFAATAALGTVLGLVSQAALCVAYAWTARRTRWPASVAAGVLAFLAATVVLQPLRVSPAVAFVAVCVVLFAAASVMPARAAPTSAGRPPWWDLPGRMAVATGIVLVLTTSAPVIGARWTGLLSPFPVFALVLGAFTHRTQGAAAAADLLRGIVLGSLAHATMFALVAGMLVSRGAVWTYSVAAVAALVVNGVAIARAPRQRPAAPDSGHSAQQEGMP
jgi:hypothetical protein